MIRKIGALFLAVCIVLIMAGVAMALETAVTGSEQPVAVKAAAENSLDVVYVSVGGNDTDGLGTEESPVATLDKAVSVVKSGGTIKLLTDLDADRLTYIEAKTVTVNGNGHSITRSDVFAQKNDLARDGYNPAIIEVANGASLRLENITINDAFRREADTYLEQLTGDSNKNNEQKVQDAIIAAYHGGGTITLGSGTTLKNFGGMSAVRVGGQGESDSSSSKLIMESGSKIVDDNLGSRKGGAAAIWSQGGIVEMKAGSSVSNIDGRAIFLEDGGVADVYGAISGITANSYMTFDPGKGSTPGGGGMNNGFAGIAAAITGNSTFTLGEGGTVSNIVSDAGNASDIAFMLVGSSLITEKGSKISDINTIGIVDNNGGKIDINGTVSDCTTENVLFRLRGAAGTFILGENGLIDNVSTTDAGIVYLNGGTPTVEISGTIQNAEVGRSSWAVIYMSPNGVREQGTLKLTSTGKITNITEGYAITAQESAKVSIDGEISNCSGYALEYKTYKTSLVDIGQNAKISNTNGIYIVVGDREGKTAVDAYQHVVFESGAAVSDVVKISAFNITLDDDYSTVKLGNASADAATAINDSVSEQHSDWKVIGLNAAWIQPSESEVHLTVDRPSSVKKMGLFAAYVPLNEDGTPVEGEEAVLTEIDNSETLDIELTGLTAGRSYALMLVNNAEYTLTPDDVTIYRGGGQGDETYDNGGFPELTIKNSVDLGYTGDITSLEIKGEEIKATDEKTLLDQLIENLDVKYTHSDGTVATDDSKPGEYAVTLSWKNGLTDEDVRINGNDVKLEGAGTLIVRDVDNVTGATSGDTTHELLDSEPTAPVEHAEAIAKTETSSWGTVYQPSFYLNDDDDREIEDPSGIQILDDGLLLEEDDNRQELMEQKAADYLRAPAEGQAYRYDFHYLDLVDAFNGNAWVSASYGTTVYLPYPEGVTAANVNELGVKVIHYKDLHREYGISGQAEVEEAIAACELETMEVEFDANGIKFDVPREGFSPFAVVWKTEAHTITATAGAGGSIDPEGKVIVADGADKTFTFTPDAGYTLDTVKIDGQPVSVEGNSYTIEDVKDDMTIHVTFKSNSGGGGFGGGSGSTHVTTDRIGGDDRFETAVKVAERLKSKLGVKKFDTILVADSDDFADALSAAPLASEKDAPILVVNERNEKYVKEYIDENLASGGRVYIIGETAAVSEDFEESLEPHKVTRLGGADRYETNLKVLKELNLKGEYEIMVASGQDYPDALSASATGNPILLVKDSIFDYQKEYLKTLGTDDDYFVIGGTAAVNEKIADQLKEFDEDGVSRVWGDDRYETAEAVANRFFRNARAIYIASGDDYPDALTGGVIAQENNAPLLLVNERNYSEAARFVDSHSVRRVTAIGGPAAVSDKVLRAVAR